MAKVNIDLEKLICALMKRYYLIHNFDRSQVKCWLDDVLEDCGIEYKDGNLHYIGEEEKKPATIKFEEEPKKKVHLADLDIDDDELRTRIKELIHQNEATFGSGYWDKETIEQLHKETDEGSKKINEVLRKAIFWKEPDFDDMVLKAEMKYQLSPDALGLYRKGLEDMWNKMKENKV